MFMCRLHELYTWNTIIPHYQGYYIQQFCLSKISFEPNLYSSGRISPGKRVISNGSWRINTIYFCGTLILYWHWEPCYIICTFCQFCLYTNPPPGSSSLHPPQHAGGLHLLLRSHGLQADLGLHQAAQTSSCKYSVLGKKWKRREKGKVEKEKTALKRILKG